MITKLANKITTYLVHKKIVSWEDVPIYVYGYEAILASCINFLVVIGLGILFQQVFEALVFFGVFALTRVYSGGYHANSYFRCNIVLAIIYLLVISLNHILLYCHIKYVALIFLGFYLSAILKFAPVPNSNKQVTDSERIRCRKICIAISGVWTILVLSTYRNYFQFSLNVANTLLSIALLLVVEKISKGEWIYNEEST